MDKEQVVLKIISSSSLYQGKYVSRVLNQGGDAWAISMPHDGGKIIPLPVGTIIELEFSHKKIPPFQAEILARRFKGEHSLYITAPGVISRGGRESYSHKSCRVIAFSSGKGGVGKSTLLINTALALQNMGKKTCIIDADLGTADIDTLLNLEAAYNLYDLIEGKKKITDIIVHGPQGVLLVPGGSGLEDLANLRDYKFSRLISAFNQLEGMADYILIDTGAGVARNVVNFLLAADEIVLVTVPEPSAILDAYALIKVLANHQKKCLTKIIVNKVEKEQEAQLAWEAVNSASLKFLSCPVQYLGAIPFNKLFALSTKKQEPFYMHHRDHQLSCKIKKISETLIDSPERTEETGLSPFIHRLKRLLVGA